VAGAADDGRVHLGHPPDPLAAAIIARPARRGRARRSHPPDPLAAVLVRRMPRTWPPAGPPGVTPRSGQRYAARDHVKARASERHRWAALLLPLLTMMAVVGVEMSSRQWTFIGYSVLVPMVAANLSGPRVTSLWVVASLGVGSLSVWWDRLYGHAHGGAISLFAWFAGILFGGLMAILASRYNSGRETKLANIAQVADAAQRAILSDVPGTSVSGLRVAVRYESAATEAMVGGDLYEMVETPWGTRMLVGDARGKGLDAVRLASRVLGAFRVAARERPRLSDVLAPLDREVALTGADDDFVTAVVVEVSRGPDGRDLVRLANAGHPDVILLRGGHAVALAPDERQQPLGLGAGGGTNQVTVAAPLYPGDRLLLYTDGVAEAREPLGGAFFPLLPAVERTMADPDASLDGCLTTLVSEVRRWTGDHLRDDMALLAVEVPPEPAAAPRPPGAGAAPASRQ
jgi:serine phosphatase RsbU (regulator of sigma subunit)